MSYIALVNAGIVAKVLWTIFPHFRPSMDTLRRRICECGDAEQATTSAFAACGPDVGRGVKAARALEFEGYGGVRRI